MTQTSVLGRAGADLSVFSDPRSVAVVGASEDPAKWGYWLASGALTGARRRAVHLVNSRTPYVLGQPCAASLLDLGRNEAVTLIECGDGAALHEGCNA